MYPHVLNQMIRQFRIDFLSVADLFVSLIVNMKYYDNGPAQTFPIVSIFRSSGCARSPSSGSRSGAPSMRSDDRSESTLNGRRRSETICLLFFVSALHNVNRNKFANDQFDTVHSFVHDTRVIRIRILVYVMHTRQ